VLRVRLTAPWVEDRIIELGRRDTHVGSSLVEGLAPRHFLLRNVKDGVLIQLISRSLALRGGKSLGSYCHQLGLGESAQLGAFTVTVEAEALPAGEERALVENSQSQDQARLVYADWLEEAGRIPQAGYLRAEVAAHLADPLGSELKHPAAAGAELRTLRELRDRAGSGFRALVARRPIENCGAEWQFKCPKKWSDLALTDEPSVRSCSACRKNVTFCHSIMEARELAAEGHCVAVDATQPRREGDLSSDLEMVTVGRMVGAPAQPPAPPAVAPGALPPRAMGDGPTMTLWFEGREAFTMYGDTATIGRAQRCDVVIPSASLSRMHAQYIREGDDFLVEDLGSVTGVVFASTGARIAGRTRLTDGEEITFGTARVKVAISTGDAVAPRPAESVWARLTRWARNR
jgi:uncharacterized protein (TIGR02996 family)